MTTPAQDLLTPDETAAMLKISKKTLHAHIKAGEIAFIQIGRGEKRVRMNFDVKDIQDFIESRRKRQCPSLSTPKAHIINTISSSAVIGFMAQREQRIKEKQLRSKKHNESRPAKI